MSKFDIEFGGETVNCDECGRPLVWEPSYVNVGTKNGATEFSTVFSGQCPEHGGDMQINFPGRGEVSIRNV